MTKAKLINGVTLDGDSGGFYRSGNALVGVHHGSNTSDGYTYVFLPRMSILMKRGLLQR